MKIEERLAKLLRRSLVFLLNFVLCLLQYLSRAGYCPQSNSLIEQLTAEEMLKLVASIRGIYAKDRKEEADKWISIAGMLA